jgi:putative hemolysin
VQIIIIVGLILLNGLFALAEIAVIAAREARLQERAYREDQGALDALKLKENPNRFLSTIQIGITLIGTLAGAFGGASVAEQVTELLQRVPFLVPYADALGVGVVVLAITYLSLVLGELAPKRLALSNPDSFAVRLAPIMVRLSALTSPIVTVLTVSTQAVLKLVGVQETEEPPVSDEEIRLLMAEGAQAGIFEDLESEMVSGVLRLGEQRARAVMTPRREIVWLDLNDPLQQSLAKIRDSGYSRFPVCRDNLDNVVGMAYAKDLLSRHLTGEPLDLSVELRQPLFFPEGLPALEMLERFRDSEVHVALILDEYSGVEGLITLRDLLEGIVGQLPTPGPMEAPSAVPRGEDAWLVDGNYLADELGELLDLRELPQRELLGYETVAGMVLGLLDRIPERGEVVTWAGWSFEVVDMDGRRIDQLLVSPLGSDEGPAAEEDG